MKATIEEQIEFALGLGALRRPHLVNETGGWASDINQFLVDRYVLERFVPVG